MTDTHTHALTNTHTHTLFSSFSPPLSLYLLQEIFLTSLLPDRKLRVLEQQPLTALPPGRDGERMLLMWAVEDAVKRRYAQFVELLQQCRCGRWADRAVQGQTVRLSCLPVQLPVGLTGFWLAPGLRERLSTNPVIDTVLSYSSPHSFYVPHRFLTLFTHLHFLTCTCISLSSPPTPTPCTAPPTLILSRKRQRERSAGCWRPSQRLRLHCWQRWSTSWETPAASWQVTLPTC